METEAGKHLKEEIEFAVAKCRMQVDFITPVGLPILQGKISAFKDILDLLGSSYE